MRTVEILDRSAFGPRPTKAGEDGRFELPSPHEGAALVITHESGVLVHFGAALLDLGELRLRPWETLTGRAVVNGRAVTDGRVYASMNYPASREGGVPVAYGTGAAVGEDGRFTIRRLPPGAATLTLRSDDAVLAKTEVNVEPGEEVEVDFGR